MKDTVEIHVSFDDHDSPRGGCTTHLASLFIRVLLEKRSLGVFFKDYPLLVRLNPGIPWKTRGNGAVVLRLKVPLGVEHEVLELAEAVSQEYSALFRDKTSMPGVAALVGGDPAILHRLYKKAVSDVVTLDVALRYASKAGVVFPSPGEARGLIGAVSALGGLLEGEDHTFELIAYRRPEYWGEPRRISGESVRRMALHTQPLTFHNYDFMRRRPLIAPHGSDPVLLGIRGEYPWVLRAALGMLEIDEPLDAWVIFRTNQGTDAHCVHRGISELRPYQSACVRGVVADPPRILRGGHVCFSIAEDDYRHQACVYEPAKPLNLVAARLWRGDEIMLLGTVRPSSGTEPQTINVEKIWVLRVAPKIIYRNPRCPRCGHTMKSAGRGKGFKCPKCGYRLREASKVPVKQPRLLKPGVYASPPGAAGHLLKPLSRMGREKHGFPSMPEHWYSYG